MRAMLRVLLDKPLRERLKQRGYEQVKKFSWDESARQILAVYGEVAGKARGGVSLDNRKMAQRVANS
jgi:glycosyltransferase involved in cell wall biosynthesis